MDQQKLLQDAFFEIMEEFAFLFLERTEEPLELPSGVPYISSTIVVQHQQDRFQIQLVAPASMCIEMAANITGSDEEDIIPEMAEDALKELSNITAGSWAVRCFGESDVCILESPNAFRLPEETLHHLLASKKNKIFQVDEQLVLAEVSAEKEA
jgi:chemotaxis protein CheY-P-specific phosphatase CheC